VCREPHPDTLALRGALRELVALSTIPAAWVGRDPPIIADGLADALVGSLHLDFAFVRLRDPKGGGAVEVTRGDVWKAFPEWLQTHQADVGQFSSKQVVNDVDGAQACRGVVIPVGVKAEGGLVAAACTRADFPSEIDQLLLSVAANHAAAAFQNARLRHELDAKLAELRQARSELELKVAERTADLQRSEAYLADAQKLTHTGSWAYNFGTREMRHSSEQHSRLYGFDPENGMPSAEECVQRIHPEDRSRVVEIVETANSTQKDFEAQFRVLLPDDTTRYLHCIGHPVLKPSGYEGEFVGILMDVTERKLAREERERLLQAQADLAHINRVNTMGELTASLAHEIRQPISAAVTNAKTCLRWLGRAEPDVAEAREAASRIVNDVRRAADIIGGISSLFKKGSSQRELVDVNELVGEMIVLLRSEASRNSISIRTQLAENLPKVMADRVQLQQVFMNLILNGIEAMRKTSAGSELTIKSELAEGQLLISVSDTGVGLPAEQADQIFKAFFTTKKNGTGMGLPISRSIIESHGGRLWANSASGRGATFQFTLPITLAAHA
jgi:signal transduction histidine kinase